MNNPPILLTLSFGQNRSIHLSEKTVLIIVLMTGALLRFMALGRWSLWIDELYNLDLMPVSAMLAQGIPADQHPPLYYLLLEGVLNLGRSEWLMRLPSALAGVLTIPMMWLTGRALKRPNLGILAAALLTLAPLHIWYSREARMYGLAMLFWTAAIYFYIQLLERDNWLDVLGLALTMTGGLYTAYPTLALWIGQMALFFLLWQFTGKRRERLIRWLVAQTAVAILFAGWWPFLQKQLERPLVFNWLNIFESILGQQTAERLNQTLEQSGFATTLAGTLQLALLAGLLFILVSVLLSFLIVKRPSILNRLKQWEFVLALLISLLFLFMTVVGAIPRGLSLRRQLLVFWVPLLIFAAWAFLRLKNRWLIAAAVTLSLVLAISTAFGPAYEDWRSTATVISENNQPGDLILMSPTWTTLAFDYYYNGDIPYEGTTAQQAQGELERLNEARVVWLVVNRHPAIEDQTVNTENWFTQNANLINTYEFSHYLTVYQLEFNSP